MPRKKRRKSRKKGGSFLKALMPTCWEMGEGKRKPIGEKETAVVGVILVVIIIQMNVADILES